MKSDGEERKVRGAIKKQAGSESIYPEIPCLKKKNDEVPSHHKSPRILHCFSSSQEHNRLIVAPDHDDLRKSTASLKRGVPPSRTIDNACDLPLYFGQGAVHE